MKLILRPCRVQTTSAFVRQDSGVIFYFIVINDKRQADPSPTAKLSAKITVCDNILGGKMLIKKWLCRLPLLKKKKLIFYWFISH